MAIWIFVTVIIAIITGAIAHDRGYDKGFEDGYGIGFATSRYIYDDDVEHFILMGEYNGNAEKDV